MRGYAPSFNMKTARSLEEAYQFLSRSHGNWRPFAGGTDVMVQFESGALQASNLLDISQLKSLKEISHENGKFIIGALATFSEIQHHLEIKKYFPNLEAAAKEVGSIAIQNRATIGGNIVNASPAADSPPALMTYNAKLNFGSSQGIRQIAIKDFYLDYKKMDMIPGELLISVELERGASKGIHFYRKVGTRRAQAISKTVCSGYAEKNAEFIEEFRFSIGSVGPKTLLCGKANNFLKGKAVTLKNITEALTLFESEISPIDDIRSTGAYRLQVSKNIFRNFLESLR